MSIARCVGPLHLRRGSQIEVLQPMLSATSMAVVQVVASDAASITTKPAVKV